MVFAIATLLYVALVFLTVISLKTSRSMKKALALVIVHLVSLFLLVLLFQDLPAYFHEEPIAVETATIVENYRITNFPYPKAFRVYLEDGRQYIGLGNLEFSRQAYREKSLRIYALPKTKLITKLEFEEIPDSYFLLYDLDDLLWKWIISIFFVLIVIGLWKMIRGKEKENVRKKRKAKAKESEQEHTHKKKKKRKYKRSNFGRGP